MIALHETYNFILSEGLSIMKFESFFSDFCAAVLSGITLTVLFFLVRERWHPLPAITGHWYLETHVVSSTSQQFVGMRLKYEAMVWQAGPSVSGSIEKIFEQNSIEAFEYDNDKRTHGEITGYINRFYLRKNRIAIHINEYGRRRESSSIFELVKSGDDLVGTFNSTAAGVFGTVVWSRNQHSSSFSEVIRRQRPVRRAFESLSDPPPLS